VAHPDGQGYSLTQRRHEQSIRLKRRSNQRGPEAASLKVQCNIKIKAQTFEITRK
jgi:hypothetical protein